MRTIAHLFSGGTDSAYAAVLMAKTYDKIHLLTYNRHGFRNVENSKNYAEKLMNIYGKERISHSIINIDNEFKTLSYGNYLPNLTRYGFFNLMVCGLCKLAMHWRTIIYCLDNGIKYVSDGSGREMLPDQSQNDSVIKEMRAFYKDFGIQYFTPIFDINPEEREQTLYDMGISKTLRMKWSEKTWDLQPFCSQEYLNLLFIQYSCDERYYKIFIKHPKFLKYRDKMLSFHSSKREEIRGLIKEYISGIKELKHLL